MLSLGAGVATAHPARASRLRLQQSIGVGGNPIDFEPTAARRLEMAIENGGRLDRGLPLRDHGI